jgi:UDP-N-acetylglucosamine 2-epimerase (non-hydrolysing)
MDHLAHEGLSEISVLVGDVMTDVLFEVRDRISSGPWPADLAVTEDGYFVSTLHRAENTDDPERLRAIISGLAEIDRPVLLLAHPRLVALSQKHGISLAQGNVRPTSPLAYPELVNLVMHSSGVITDSGGLQKEAFLLGVPCTTLRTETEWVETVDLGWNVLVHDDFGTLATVVTRPRPATASEQPYGDGHAADRVADLLVAG